MENHSAVAIPRRLHILSTNLLVTWICFIPALFLLFILMSQVSPRLFILMVGPWLRHMPDVFLALSLVSMTCALEVVRRHCSEFNRGPSLKLACLCVFVAGGMFGCSELLTVEIVSSWLR